MGCASTEQPKEFDYCFRPNELSHIKELKRPEKIEETIKDRKERDIKERDDNILPLFRKVDINFIKKNVEFKEYLVLYLNDNFNKDIVEYDYIPTISYMNCIEKTEIQKCIKIAKINNDSKAMISFKAESDTEIEGNPIKIYLKFKMPQHYKEKGLITLEIDYNIKFIYDNYGLVYLNIEYENDEMKKGTFSLNVDDNYALCVRYVGDGVQVWEDKVYAFDQEYLGVFFRNKEFKINIEKELDKQLLSIFSGDEIKQINKSLNMFKYGYYSTSLVYQKVIHDIKDKKDSIKIYDIVFNHRLGSPHVAKLFSKSKQPIIIKQFKINNVVIEKKEYDENEDDSQQEEEEEEEEEQEGIKGYYCSEKKLMKYKYSFTDNFALFEFDCESNENLDYFRINCDYIGEIGEIKLYGSSFRYEINLNGNKVTFPKKDFNKFEKDGKIILEGMLDGNRENLNKEKFTELAELYNLESKECGDDERYDLINWNEMIYKDSIPETMKLE